MYLIKLYMQVNANDVFLKLKLSSYDLAPLREPVKEPVHPDIQYIQERPWLKHIRRRAIATILEESEPPSGVQSQKTSASIAGRR